MVCCSLIAVGMYDVYYVLVLLCGGWVRLYLSLRNMSHPLCVFYNLNWLPQWQPNQPQFVIVLGHVLSSDTQLCMVRDLNSLNGIVYYYIYWCIVTKFNVAFILIKNSIGQGIEPCGTPADIFDLGDLVPSIDTNCSLSFKK